MTLTSTLQIVPNASTPTVEYTLYNQGAITIHVCTYYTPLEGSSSENLHILDQNQVAAIYFGPSSSRSHPSAASFVTLAPGTKISKQFDLGNYHLIQGNTYTISVMNNHVQCTSDLQAPMPYSLHHVACPCNAVTLAL